VDTLVTAPNDLKAAVEAGMAGIGFPGVLTHLAGG